MRCGMTRVLELIERVPLVRMTGWDARVIEGQLGLMDHAELFHDAARGGIAYGCDGDDFGEIQLLKCEVYDGGCAFGGESLALEVGRETPADFNCGLRQVGDDVAHGL